MLTAHRFFGCWRQQHACATIVCLTGTPWLHTVLICWMLLTLYTLPQLAVSAKLLCLLMVVICGAVPSMVRSVRLYNQCSSNTIRVNMNGSVFASDSIPDKFQNLTIQSHDFKVKLTIFAETSRRYLCFNKKWKLVGFKHNKGLRCQFLEHMDASGYSRYESCADSSYYIGFNHNGRPLGRNKRARQKNPNCINFLKYDTEFSIGDHNSRFGGGGFIPRPKRKDKSLAQHHKRHHKTGNGVRSRIRHSRHRPQRKLS